MAAERSDLDRARALLREAERVVLVTGAGVSADSGVPTFRGEDGLWKTHRPEELATPDAFRRDPRLVWEWYAWRRGLIRGCRPNAAHRAIAEYLVEHPSAVLVTQNVDGLHTLALSEAGAPDAETRNRILELHGAIFRTRCTGCGRLEEHRAEIDPSSEATLPRCGDCDALLRPDVVWFGERLPERTLQAAFAASAAADACLVVGTSSIVYPAAQVPLLTLENGGAVVEVNPEPTPLTPRAAVSIRGRAAETVPALL